MPVQRTPKRKNSQPGPTKRKTKKTWLQREKEELVASEISSVKKLKADIASLTTSKSKGIGSRLLVSPDTSVLYQLRSVDHFENCYRQKLFPTMYVEFTGLNTSPHLTGNTVYGYVYLEWDVCSSFISFKPPKRASRDWYKLKSREGLPPVEVQFITQDHLVLRVARKSINKALGIGAKGPDYYEYVGFVGPGYKDLYLGLEEDSDEGGQELKTEEEDSSDEDKTPY